MAFSIFEYSACKSCCTDDWNEAKREGEEGHQVPLQVLLMDKGLSPLGPRRSQKSLLNGMQDGKGTKQRLFPIFYDI